MVVGNRNRIPANQIEGHRWESIPYVELVCHGFMLGRSRNPGQRQNGSSQSQIAKSDRIPYGSASRHAPNILAISAGPASFDIEQRYVKTTDSRDIFCINISIKVNYSTFFLNFYLIVTKHTAHFR